MHASFGGNPLFAYRGITCDSYVFNDEENLHTFLSLSEGKTEEYPCRFYEPKQDDLFDTLHLLWDVNPKFKGDYIFDYKLLQNEELDVRTSWRDKYTTVIYSPNSLHILSRREMQPLPDYIRWFKTSEIHYMPYEERKSLREGPWDTIPGLFLPTTVLDLCHMVAEDPPHNVITAIAILAWTTVSEVKEYYSKITKRLKETMKNDEERERWKNHTLYSMNTKITIRRTMQKEKYCIHISSKQAPAGKPYM